MGTILEARTHPEISQIAQSPARTLSATANQPNSNTWHSSGH